MNYNEYKAPKGKMLINLDNFTCGHTMLSKFELNVLVVDQEDAERLCKEYAEKKEALFEEIQKQKEEEFNQQSNSENESFDKPKMMSRSMSDISEVTLNEDGEYEVTEDSEEDSQENPEENEGKYEKLMQTEIDRFKKDAVSELILKGVKFDKSDVVLLQHNTESN